MGPGTVGPGPRSPACPRNRSFVPVWVGGDTCTLPCMTFHTGRPQPSRVRLHRAGGNYATMRNWVRLASSGWYLFLDDVVADAGTQALIAEDSCWQFAVDDWRARRPHRWRFGARREWRAEERCLATEQARLIDASSPLRTLRPLAGCE